MTTIENYLTNTINGVDLEPALISVSVSDIGLTKNTDTSDSSINESNTDKKMYNDFVEMSIEDRYVLIYRLINMGFDLMEIFECLEQLKIQLAKSYIW